MRINEANSVNFNFMLTKAFDKVLLKIPFVTFMALPKSAKMFITDNRNILKSGELLNVLGSL